MKLIIGGDSNIGRSLSKFWSESGVEHHASTRQFKKKSKIRPFIDLESIDMPEMQLEYTAVVYCAGVTSLNACESNSSVAYQVNVVGILALARHFSKSGTYQLLLSSDKVVSDKQAHTNRSTRDYPETEYGRQKFEAEKGILDINNTGVLRISKVISPETPLLRQWESDLISGKTIFPYYDVSVRPVSLLDVVKKIDGLISKRAVGISYAYGLVEQTYVDLARKLVNELAVSEKLLHPVSFLNRPLSDENTSLDDFDTLKIINNS